MQDAKYFVVNELANGEYIFSEAYLKVEAREEYDSLDLNFVTSDIG